MLARTLRFMACLTLVACPSVPKKSILEPPRHERVYLPGDVVYVTVDESGQPTGEIQAKIQLDGAHNAPDWWTEVTKVRAYPVTGDDQTFNAGLRFESGRLQLNFGASGAKVTRIGERFPGDVEKKAEVHGRAAVRRLPFDSFQTAFEILKDQPFQRYLPNRIPIQPEQRAFYVEQVIYTNAYYASCKARGGLNLTTKVFGKDKPLVLGTEVSGGSFAYFLSADATSVPNVEWKYGDDERRQMVVDEWVTVAVVLQELDLREVPLMLGGKFWENSEAVATAIGRGDWADSHTEARELVLGKDCFEVGPKMEYALQTACWSTSRVTTPPLDVTVQRLKWSVSVESRFGGMCGPNGSNKGGHGKAAPRVELRVFSPEGWTLVAGAVANGDHGAPNPRPACTLSIIGPALKNGLGPLAVEFGRSRAETRTDDLARGEYTIEFSAPSVEQGCYGDNEGIRREGTTSFTFDFALEAPRQ